MNKLPKFLLIRFPPGGCGNFLASVLQCSADVGHWHSSIEKQKPNVDWVLFFQKHFTTPLSDWTHNEPLAYRDWGVKNIFSASYPRGNNLSIDEYLKIEGRETSEHFKTLKDDDKLLPIFWHKEFIPSYFNNSIAISVQLDKKSLRWFDHSIYFKHHKISKVNEDKSVVVSLKEHRKSYQVGNFNNQSEVTYGSFKEFVTDRIINNKHRQNFQDTAFINAFPYKNITIQLSDILEWDKFKKIYPLLCEHCNINKQLDTTILKMLFNHWRDLHDY